MNKHILEGEWKQLKGAAKEKWGELTDDEIDQTEGETQKLIGKIQAKYGYEYETFDNVMSPAFVYNQSANGNCGAGSTIGGALEILQTHIQDTRNKCKFFQNIL